MINQTIDRINKRDEEYRRKLAFFSSLIVLLLVFSVWSIERDIFELKSKGNNLSLSNRSGQLASVASAPSPIDSSKQALDSVWSEVGKSFNDFKESLSNVFVPFFTGIEVYERK